MTTTEPCALNLGLLFNELATNAAQLEHLLRHLFDGTGCATIGDDDTAAALLIVAMHTVQQMGYMADCGAAAAGGATFRGANADAWMPLPLA